MTESTAVASASAAWPPGVQRRQRVAVVGGGAIGTIVAHAAHRAGHKVTLCVRSPLAEVTVEREGAQERLSLPAVTRPDRLTAPVDWLFLATKTYDTQQALGWIRALTGPATRVVALQNGVDHQERIGPLLVVGELLPALVYISAERVSRTHVVHRWGRRLVVPDTAAGSALAALFAAGGSGGVDVVTAQDFTTAAWRKFLTNVAANPLTALTLRRIGALQEPRLRELARGLLREAVTVGVAEGASLSGDDVEQTLDLYAAMHPHSGTSMLHDRLARRRLEHDLITGSVVRAAERHGLAVPLNQAMLALLQTVEAQNAVEALERRPAVA
ncbi:2-dehydropantoate 2-reductase [Salinactinospora qingdaonensis]|uniref:2-dehydropantoate 2-reductase n=1 Tax=Salinactinospora qingdaonensis TaxID=702744 RepID=A0ABP7EY82_9ACTN